MEQFSRSFIKNIKRAKDKYKIQVPLYKVPKALRDLKIHFSSLHAFSDQKIIWIKMPKTAGTSVQKCLEDAGHLYMMKPGKRAITGIYSRRVEEFKSLYPEFWQDAWKFAVVRNPYDKFVSGWKYLRATRDLPIKEVLLNPPKKESSYHDWTHLTRLQSDVLYDGTGKMIVDRVIHFEEVELELNTILNERHLASVALPFVNRSLHREPNYVRYYDDDAKRLLADRYKQDLKNFGYEF